MNKHSSIKNLNKFQPKPHNEFEYFHGGWFEDNNFKYAYVNISIYDYSVSCDPICKVIEPICIDKNTLDIECKIDDLKKEAKRIKDTFFNEHPLYMKYYNMVSLNYGDSTKGHTIEI